MSPSSSQSTCVSTGCGEAREAAPVLWCHGHSLPPHLPTPRSAHSSSFSAVPSPTGNFTIAAHPRDASVHVRRGSVQDGHDTTTAILARVRQDGRVKRPSRWGPTPFLSLFSYPVTLGKVQKAAFDCTTVYNDRIGSHRDGLRHLTAEDRHGDSRVDTHPPQQGC